MTSTKNTYHQITANYCGLNVNGKYKKINKDTYKLIMEIPFKFERTYKEDILEIEELVEWIMRQELIEIMDDYYEIKENSLVFEKTISEIEERENYRDLSKYELSSNLFNLLEKYFPKESKSLKIIIDSYSISEIKYLLSIEI